MMLKTGRIALWLGALAPLLMLMSHAGPAHAQRWDQPRPEWNQNRWERDREEADRRDRERRRRDDAKATGLVVGVVGTAIVASIIAAAANKEKEQRARADYCVRRYGNYDRATDTYRATDGYTYRCQ